MPYKDHEKLLVYRRSWRAAHAASERQKARDRRAKNLEAARAYDSQWKRDKRQKDPEAVRAYDHDYYAARPEKRAARAQRSQAWRIAYPARVQKLNRGYREAHRDVLNAHKRMRPRTSAQKAQASIYRRLHLEHIIARHHAWKKAHPGMMVMYALQRRARKHGATGDGLTPAQWQELCAAVKYRCVYCWKKYPFKELTRDHLTPLGEGADHLHNILPACRSCNAKKKRGPVLCPVQPFLLTVAQSPQRRRSVCAENISALVSWPVCA